MKVPFTWKITGWFMVGWSAEFSKAEARPLRYFGEDLVAYRDESGELHVLSGHCRHLGAHIGHGGKVVGDCVECPFHGWRWGLDGTNRYKRPALFKVDAKPYMATRKWATQFYEVPATPPGEVPASV